VEQSSLILKIRENNCYETTCVALNGYQK